MKSSLLIFLVITSPVLAEMSTDGSLGARVEFTGKHFAITPDLGQQMGANLFHSFEQFSLKFDESATFSGDSQVKNIIARVTGGQPSMIDGILRSTVADADLYLMNPAGIMFGKNAQLNLQGGFHATTANELRFNDGAIFSATPKVNALLTVAPIQSFGFLNEISAPIELQDSQLRVPEGRNISLIGGALNLHGRILTDASGEPVIKEGASFFQFPAYRYTTELNAPAGRVYLASVASLGSATLQEDALTVTAARLGNIDLDHSEVITGGIGRGHIFVHGADLTLNHGRLSNPTEGQYDGGEIDIRARDVVIAGTPTSAKISADAYSSGHGGSINLTVDNLELRGGAISTVTHKSGHGGNIAIQVKDRLKLSNPIPEAFKFGSIFSDTFGMADGYGAGGNIAVTAKNIEIHEVTSIAATSYGYGDTGDLNITAEDILVTGTAILNGWSHNAAINTSSYLGSAFTKSFGREGKGGSAGHISLTAQRLTLSEVGLLLSDAYSGNAGQINVHAEEINILSGGNIACSTFGEGLGGQISITAQRLNISENNPNRLYPSGIYSDSLSTQTDAGNSGNIDIKTASLKILENSVISSSTQNAVGGNIYLTIQEYLYLWGGEITTSVQGGIGNGGDIMVTDAVMVINDGKIVAQADAGKGGNIHLVTQHLIPSADSLLSASSRVGIDGNIFISSPINDLSGQVLGLSTEFIDGAALLPRSCAARVADQRPSEFIRPFRLQVHHSTARASPDDLFPSSSLLMKLY